MSKIYCPIDFEYRGTSEARLDLICCSFSVNGETFEYWLRDNHTYTCNNNIDIRTHLLKLRANGVIFLCWNYVAEGQSFIALGLNPVKFKVIDLQQEYKMLLNHYSKYAHGEHLKDGKIVKISPPKYGDAKVKAPSSLSAGCFKLLGIKIDTEHKEEMRKICIHGSPAELETNKKAITDYCTSDIKNLEPIWDVIKKEYVEFFKRKQDDDGLPIQVKYEHCFWRAETMARTALMTSLGYPVDVKKMRTFAGNVKPLLKELAEDINSQFEYDIFYWNKRDDRYSKNTKLMKKLIGESEFKDVWKRSKKTEQYSLENGEFEKHFPYRHDYPRGNPFAQYLRYLKTNTSLNGFLPKSLTAKSKETIFDSLGSDGRIRAWLNPYGSQSARYQPKATSYIPLKAAWMRSLIAPSPGSAIAGIDYKSEEFLLGALVSNDKNMLEAYKSGDVYLHFAKLAGAVPKDGTKKEYAEERNLFKSTTLGISYLMGPAALGRKLTADTGKVKTTDDARKLINIFAEAYPDYTQWQDNIYYFYQRKQCLMLPCGWFMYGDNPNERSTKNFPVQGIGSSILRKAIALAQDRGLKVILPLHDALYIEYPSDDLSHVDILKECMREAFGFYFEGKLGDMARDLIGFDVNVWSPDYADGSIKTPGGIDCKKQTVYIDDRSEKEFYRFKKYMEAE